MHIVQKTLHFLSGVVAMLSLSACNGIFSDIYDEPIKEFKTEYGFIAIDNQTNKGTIYVDATDYTEWHYIDLTNKTMVTKSVDDAAPENWDFAIHRYDAKTNGGAVAATDADDFDSLPDIIGINEESFIADVWTENQITIDMSQMMDGIILYAADYFNPCLSEWLNVDTSTMPPIYTLSKKIYLLRLADGTYAALRLSNFMNDAATKGFMSVDYYYPIQI